MVNTSNLGGQTLHKKISVMTNDPKKPRTELMITGKVGGYVTIEPSYVRLMGRSGEDISAVVHILPSPGHPFTIKEAKARNNTDFRLEIKPLGKNPLQDGYELVVTNTKTDPGIYRDYIDIQTDLKQKPILKIPVSGRIYTDESMGPGNRQTR